jgi:hypothetical protein
MLQHHPDTSQPQVCYFYLPPLTGKPAEVIVVLNANCETIRIPVPEEDLELQAFYQRSITSEEAKRFGNEPVWRIFDSWAQLELDHRRYKVNPTDVEQLASWKITMPLHQQLELA